MSGNTTPAWVRYANVIFIVAVGIALFYLFLPAVSTLLLGVLAASIVASTLNPLVRRVPGPRGLAAGLIGLGMLAAVATIILALSWPLATPIKRQLDDWPNTQQSLDQLLQNWSARLHFDKPVTSGELLNDVRRFLTRAEGSTLLADVRDAVLSVLLWSAFIFVGSIFMLASPRDVLLEPMLRVFAPLQRQAALEMLNVLGSRLRWWMAGTLTGVCIVFIASNIGYSIAGLKFAFPLALLAGIGEIVPTVGPAIAAAVALLFAATQGTGAVAGVTLTYVSIQSLEAYLILPIIMRHAVKVHPAVTLFSVVFWGKMFGVPGLMMAIPINLAIGSIIEFLYIRPREQRELENA